MIGFLNRGGKDDEPTLHGMHGYHPRNIQEGRWEDSVLNHFSHFEDSNLLGTTNKASIDRETFERKTAQANRLRRSLIADAL